MITVRPIHADEVEAFAAIGSDSEEIRSSVRTYVEDMLERGAMRLDWCFVLEENGNRCGRAAYWTLPGHDKPLDVVLWELPWHREDCLTLAKSLFEDMFVRLLEHNCTQVGYILDSPSMAPQWQSSPESRQKILAALGFQLQRETCRFERHIGIEDTASKGNLTYRTLPEVGEEAFVEAILQVSQSTGDRYISREREAKGAKTQAWEMFRELQRMDYDQDWWQLAYDVDGQLVGFVMPTKAPAFATIGYIGVVPEQRGRGHIDSLLHRVSVILGAANETYLRADTDIGNTPMAKAFERAGYRHFANRQEYSLSLRHPG